MAPRFVLTGSLCIAIAACGGRSDLATAGREPGDGSGGHGGGAASTPACETLYVAGDGSGATDVALDATHAYWTTSDGNVLRVELETGERDTLFAGTERLTSIALDDRHVYTVWETGLLRVPTTGGAAEPLAAGPSFPIDVAVSRGEVFVLEQEKRALDDGKRPGALWAWTEGGGFEVVQGDLHGDLAELVVDERDFLIRMTTEEDGSTMLLRIDRNTHQAEELPLGRNGGQIALTSSEIVHIRPSDAVQHRLSLLATTRATGRDRMVAHVDADRRVGVIGIAVEGLEVFFATNMVEYGAVVTCAEAAPARVPLEGGPIVPLAYERPEGTLTHPAATSTHVAFARSRDQCASDLDGARDDDGVVVFCR